MCGVVDHDSGRREAVKLKNNLSPIYPVIQPIY